MVAAVEWQKSPHDLGDAKLHVLQVACQQVEGDPEQLGLQALEGPLSRGHSTGNLNAHVEIKARKGYVQGAADPLPDSRGGGGEVFVGACARGLTAQQPVDDVGSRAKTAKLVLTIPVIPLRLVHICNAML